MNVEEGLALYGALQQIFVGDVNTVQPWSFQIILYMFWWAWKDLEGKTDEETMTIWVDQMKPIFERNNITFEDPREEIETAEYDACLEKMRGDLDIMVTHELISNSNFKQAIGQELASAHEAGLEELFSRYQSEATDEDQLRDLLASKKSELEQLKNQV